MEHDVKDENSGGTLFPENSIEHTSLPEKKFNGHGAVALLVCKSQQSDDTSLDLKAYNVDHICQIARVNPLEKLLPT